MLRKYAAVLLITTLITGPAFAQKPAPNPPNSSASTGGGSSGYNQTLNGGVAFAQTPSRPLPTRPTSTRPAPKPTINLTGGGSSGFNETLSRN